MDAIILKSFLPEIFFSICILIQLVFNARLINNLKYNFPIIYKEVFNQTFFILLCLLLIFSNLRIEGFFSNLLFLNDKGAILIKSMVILSSLFILIIVSRGIIFQNLNFFEFFTMFSLSILALLLLVSSYDFVSAYLVIEMQALCFYVLASFRRNSAFSTEAGLKYFISGSFISCIFLFGCSLIYGALGTLNFNSLNLLLSFPLSDDLIYIKYMTMVGCLFIFITLLFKVAAAPFHFWSPDVYEGAPLSSTVIFSIIPKLVIFNFFIKCISAFSQIFYEFQILFLIIGLLSIFIGTFFALSQKRIKRLVIYSSIAQVGFLVSALATNTLDGFASIYFFLFVYIISSILVWGYITEFYSSQQEVNIFHKKAFSPIFLSSLSNYFKVNKVAAFSLMVVFFSIAGIPPLTGFLSKIFIIFGLISSNFWLTSVVIVLVSSISVFYYIRIVKVLFFETKDLRVNNQNIQTTFSVDLFDLYCTIMALGLYLLFFFFLFPEIPMLGSHYIVLNTSGF